MEELERIRYMGCDSTEQRGQRRFMFGIVMDVRNVGIYSNRRDVNNSRNGSHTRDFSPTWASGTKLARNGPLGKKVTAGPIST